MTRYIIPGGGLCNRMRVIKSAIESNKSYGAKVIVFWRINSELGSSYESLFESSLLKSDSLSLINISNKNPIYWILHPKILSLYKFICKITSPSCRIFLSNDTKSYLTEVQLKTMENCDRVLIYSHHSFMPFNELNEFTPNNKLQREIDLVTSNFNYHTIGIHIRRTDNKEAVRSSPTILFIEYMDKLLLDNAETNFFLSTDDKNVKVELVKKFGKKLYTRNISYNRSTENAINDAIVDLYSLSKTRHLLCSHYSSFSEIASILGHRHKNIEIVQLKETEEEIKSL